MSRPVDNLFLVHFGLSMMDEKGHWLAHSPTTFYDRLVGEWASSWPSPTPWKIYDRLVGQWVSSWPSPTPWKNKVVAHILGIFYKWIPCFYLHHHFASLVCLLATRELDIGMGPYSWPPYFSLISLHHSFAFLQFVNWTRVWAHILMTPLLLTHFQMTLCRIQHTISHWYGLWSNCTWVLHRFNGLDKPLWELKMQMLLQW